MKKYLSVLLTLGIFLSTCACSKQPTGGDEPNATMTNATTTNAGLTEATVNVGEYLSFGKYEQDNNTANGQEPIEWLVLEVKDGKALLVSRYGLDCQPYNELFKAVTWKTCSLRQWLNAEFFNTAFSAEERKHIPTVTVPADKNPKFALPKYASDPGKATKDKVFLLSIAEAERYFGSDGARQCESTDYAKGNGVSTIEGNCRWWLRTPGYFQFRAAFVFHDGSFCEEGDNGYNEFYAVRPALWMNLNS